MVKIEWDGLTGNFSFYGEIRGYFRSVWTAVYRFWAYLDVAPKLGKPGKKRFVKGNIDVSCKYFFFLFCHNKLFGISKKCQTLTSYVRHFNRRFESFSSKTALAL